MNTLNEMGKQNLSIFMYHEQALSMEVEQCVELKIKLMLVL